MLNKKNYQNGTNPRTISSLFMSLKRYLFCVLFLIIVIPISCLCIFILAAQDLFSDRVCEAWSPGMSEKEKIMLVLEVANSRDRILFEHKTSTGFRTRGFGHQIPFESAEAILDEQPDCCGLYVSEEILIPLDSIKTKSEGTVVIRYLGRRYDKKKDEVYRERVYMSQNFNLCK